MKKLPKKESKNEKRIHDQEYRERAIRNGDPASQTPQGAGLGNSSQSAMKRNSQEDMNPRYEPIDPESERQSAAQERKSPKSKEKSGRGKSNKGKGKGSAVPENTLDNPDKENRIKGDDKTSQKKKTKSHESIHWEGKGDPDYASPDSDRRRQWLEKEK